jgi:hypothetical protein
MRPSTGSSCRARPPAAPPRLPLHAPDGRARARQLEPASRVTALQTGNDLGHKIAAEVINWRASGADQDVLRTAIGDLLEG